MVKKLLIHLSLFLVVLIGGWLALSQLNFKKMINADKHIERAEDQLGKWTIRFFKNENEFLDYPRIDSAFQVLTEELTVNNSFYKAPYQILLFRNEQINAFALPGNTIVVYTGLIEFTQSAEELCGVLAHEIAHIEQSHVTKKLGKEIGLAALFSIMTGSYNMEVIKEVARTLSSAAYDRNLETEADELAIHYLYNAHISPNGYINLLERFAEELPAIPSGIIWISSHPDSYERANKLKDISESMSPVNTKNSGSLNKAWQTLRDISVPNS